MEGLSQDLKEAEKNMGQTLMAVYTVRREGAEATDEPSHVGIVIEGVENVALGCAMFFGLIYALNLSFPDKLKCTFEFIQKTVMNLSGQRLSPKVLALKNKLVQE
uniref:Uncharacterized protein n=1 Tax=Paramormyrops kingsleyae TaxID=1676925 RepID=A0A3B3SBI3_9TELE